MFEAEFGEESSPDYEESDENAFVDTSLIDLPSKDFLHSLFSANGTDRINNWRTSKKWLESKKGEYKRDFPYISSRINRRSTELVELGNDLDAKVNKSTENPNQDPELSEFFSLIKKYIDPKFDSVSVEKNGISAEQVVNVSDRYFFKVFSDREKLDKEVLILNKLSEMYSLHTRCQILCPPKNFFQTWFALNRTMSDEESEKVKQMLSEKTPKIDLSPVKSRYPDDIQHFKEKYIDPSKDFISLENKYIFLSFFVGNQSYDMAHLIRSSVLSSVLERDHFQTLAEVLGVSLDINPSGGEGLMGMLQNNADSAYADPLAHRLYTLALLNGDFSASFSQSERNALEGYHDISYDELVEKVSQDYATKKYLEKNSSLFTERFKKSYNKKSRRQQEIYERRRVPSSDSPLVFCHADPKWDNWYADHRGDPKFDPWFADGHSKLMDFGSAKFTTEYKDIAKALLDYEHVTNPAAVEEHSYLFKVIRDLTGFPVKESTSEFNDNVIDSLVLHAGKELYHHHKNPKVLQQMVKILNAYSS